LLPWFLKTARSQTYRIPQRIEYYAGAMRRITLINKKFVSIGESHGAAEWKPRKKIERLQAKETL
jgi:hypothetical protein